MPGHDRKKRILGKAIDASSSRGEKEANSELESELEKAKKEAEKRAAVITTHIVKEGETLSHIALKHYKHATPPYWQHLLGHNTEVLKGSEKNVRTGMELEIPELPEDLKD